MWVSGAPKMKDRGQEVEIVGAALRGRPELKMQPQKTGQPHRVAPTRTLEPWNPRTLLAIILLAIPLFFSCASPDLQPKDATPRTIVWPLPPEQPRIAFIRHIAESKDMGIKKSFFKKVADFLFGEELEPHLIRPYGVFSDSNGKLYVTDTGLQVVHIFDLEKKKYRQIFKHPWGRLLNPIGIASDPQGNIYVSDSVINRIFVYNNKGQFSHIIGREGDLQRVAGIAVNPKNDLIYAVDTAGHKIFVFDLRGSKVSEIGQRGGGDGEFNFPTHIAIDKEGWLYITDSMNFRVQIFDSEGKFINKFGRLGNRVGTFSKPKGVSVDREGHIYVVDGIYDTVQIFDREGRVLLNFGRSGTGEGDFWLPAGIFVDNKDSIYIADTYNNRVSEFRYLPQPEEEVTEGEESPAPSSITGDEGKREGEGTEGKKVTQ